MLKKIVIAAVFLMGAAEAATVPLEKIMTVEVALGEWAVFDFPFKIKRAEPTSFRSKYSVEKVSQEAEKISGGTDYLDAELPPVRKTPPLKTKGKPSASAPLIIKKHNHTISMFPKKYGEVSILVWGHKDYPVTLKVKVTKRKKGPTYLKFVDVEEEKEEASALEKTSHEKAITVLTKYLYHRKVPKGYNSRTYGRVYGKGKIRLKLVRSIIGKQYRGDEWLVKNKFKTTKKLHEEIFYRDGVYAVSFENNILRPGEATRMFIIRRVD
jgi:hypothetical protein